MAIAPVVWVGMWRVSERHKTRRGGESIRKNMDDMAILIHETLAGGKGGKKFCRHLEYGQHECGKNESKIS